jgi:hypothetical protein
MSDDAKVLQAVDDMLQAMIDLQEKKALSLARRLHPGVTAEDLRNPHDFRSLDDSDYHYEDGMLNGLLAAQSAVRARLKQLSPPPSEA